MSDLVCCYLADPAQEPLRSGMLTTGDVRALLDRYGCRRSATWEIWGASGRPDDYTHACDAHLGDLHPLRTLAERDREEGLARDD